MRSDELDWQAGKVTFWDLTFLDPAKALDEQQDDLKEDLAQVAYGARLVLDVGWLPEGADDGRFVVQIVKDRDWDEPYFREEASSVDALLEALRRAIVVARGAREALDAS